MPRGQTAKDNITKKLINFFGDNYIGEFDKKLYVWEDDGGEKVQISITLTCPKVTRGVEETESDSLNFEDSAQIVEAPQKVIDISQEEKDTLAELMAKFGL